MVSNSAGADSTHYHDYTKHRPAVLGVAKLLFLALGQVGYVSAAPLAQFVGFTKRREDDTSDTDDPSLWLYLTVAAILVLLGGAFAGLTIALMGQDGVYLQVIATSGEGKEQRHAERVYQLLKKGKHWVLVTLLLSNVIVNETLPIVLDRSLGGGLPAVLGSTALIVIFGEVIPQSVCVRYGLSIGAYMAPFVLGLMWLLAPIAWPTAKLLDKLLGEDHGTVYKKSGLKTLVTLHKTLGTSPTDRLNQDEVTIISAVLDLKDKAVGDIMTPMEDVFTMSADTVLDEPTMNAILSAGYSRIPIYEPGNPQNFVGMLLVKILITYDPEDCTKVGDFALATLPETRPETSCLDILNFFQEGKSHMVLVSEFPGENYGALGVTTLEDTVEELLGEEIIDESDVFVDVHKAIRRMAPAPKARISKGHIIEPADQASLHAAADRLIDLTDETVTENSAKSRVSGNGRVSPALFGASPKTTFIRRASNGIDDNIIQVRGNVNDMREHLKHLGPSNLASRPKTTRYNTVKIKPGQLTTKSDSKIDSANSHDHESEETPYRDLPALSDDEREGLLSPTDRNGSERTQTLKPGYGSVSHTPSNTSDQSTKPGVTGFSEGTKDAPTQTQSSGHSPSRPDRGRFESHYSNQSRDTLDSFDQQGNSPARTKRVTRSGSITENIIEAGGVRKVVLETHSSSGEDKDERASRFNLRSERNSPKPSPRGDELPQLDTEQSITPKEEEVKKKRRRPRKKKGGKDEPGSAATGSDL